MNTDRSKKKVRTGEVFLTFIQKKKYFHSTALDLMVLKSFFYKMRKKLLIKFSTELKNLKKKRHQNRCNNFNLFYGRI